MTALTKPTEKPEWATSGEVLTPTIGKRALGWIAEKPPYQWFNWLALRTYQWVNYFENITDRVASEYDAVVGSGDSATHATIAAAITDGAKNILVVSPIVLTANVTISQADTHIRFKPLATITKGGTATRGLILDAARIRVYDGRVLGFTAGGDAGFELTLNCKDSLLSGVMFEVGTPDLYLDAGANNSASNLVLET